MKTRTAIIASGIAVAVTATVLAYADDADATTTTLSGTGWRAFTENHVESINPNLTYLITYNDTGARTKMGATGERIAAQLRGLGLKVYNTTTVEKIPTGCPAQGHIIIGMKYRPAGLIATSTGKPCYNTANNSLWSGVVWMDSEYKQLGGKYVLSTKIWKDAVHHEVGHAFGLGHPAKIKDSKGNTPVMTSPNGGLNNTSTTGSYTAWDLAGFRQMMENYGV